MNSKFGLFEICYRKENQLIKLTSLLSKDGNNAIIEARRIFKQKIEEVGAEELFYRALEIKRVALNVKNPA